MADGKRRAGTTSRPSKKSKTPPEPGWPTWKRRLFKVGKWGSIAGLVLVLVMSALFFIAYRSIDIPKPNSEFLTQTTHVYYSDGKTDLGQFAIQDRTPIDLDEMPDTLKDAVVAAEDQSFWTNEGIDPKGIVRAAFSNASGGVTQGASTITQQYVKILYLTQERTWKRKIKEAILSLKIQNQYSKEQVLEGYLNTIYFGRGAYGVQAAAKAYFGVDAKDLNLKQSAVLAAVLNNPNNLDPANGKAARSELKGRYQYVVDAMVDLDLIDEDQGNRAYQRLPEFPEPDTEETYEGQKGHVLQMVRNELLELGFSDQEINGGGLEVTTTFTEKAMDAAKDGQAAARPPGLGYKNLHVAVATVEPGTGAVRGIYAGQDYLLSQLNWAVEGGQAGSTFKPFALAAGIKAGFSLKDTFEGNSPFTTENGFTVSNQGDTPYGRPNLIVATEKSVNTAYVDLTVSIPDGPQAVIDTAVDMGIPPEEAPKNDAWGFPTSTPALLPNEQVALGSQTVSPINMANGYATVANGGVAAEPFIIEKVVDQNGDTRYDHKVQDHRALSEDIAADVSYAMQRVVEAGTSQAAISGFAWPSAGKTGTATNAADEVSSSWYAGYTAQYATAVMFVRGDGDDGLDGYLEPFYGGEYPAKTWRQVMDRVMEGEEPIELAEPVYVDGDAPEEGHAPYTPPPPETTKPEKTEEPETEVTDTDGDGVPDDEDACPDNADIPGSPDENGDCVVDSPDSDGDGVPDDQDSCPDNPDIPGQPDEDGDCVVDNGNDTDGDGTPDPIDPCPENADIPALPDDNGNCIADREERGAGSNDRAATTGVVATDPRRRAGRSRRRTPLT